CVPSKALIAASRHMAMVRKSADFGVSIPPGTISANFATVMARMRRIRAEISEHDSVRRYSAELGVDVFAGDASFAGRNALQIQGGPVLHFRKCIIASGAGARVPAALQGIPHLTSSNLWNLEALPPRLLVVGSGPIGLEIAQAMQRLGSQVTVLSGASGVFASAEPEASLLIRQALERDGVTFVSGRLLRVVRRAPQGGEAAGLYQAPFGMYTAELEEEGTGVRMLEAEALLNATGRVPNLEGLQLGRALGGDSSDCSESDDQLGPLAVDEQLRTRNPDIFAAGDCLPGRDRFTHAAEWQARVAVRNALLSEGLDARQLLVPRATYTDPEVASVGRSAKELRAAGVIFETFTRQAADVDRNRCDGVTEGFAALHVAPSGVILGATVVGPSAGDHISEVTLCMQHGLTAADLAGTMHPYPTAAEVVRQAAQAFVRSRIFKPESQEMLKLASESTELVRSTITK
ncbi:unnamed protein product, partial [Polarella glacialis]